MPTPIRVLMAEDSQDDAELISIMLRRGGFEVEWERQDNEEEFSAALEKPWDIILSDFRMPRFDGLRAFALYRERRLDAPFIFVSSALGEERAVQAMRAGARDYLLKDDVARLHVVVRRELAEAEKRAARRQAEQAEARELRRLALAVEATGAAVFEHSIPLNRECHLSERVTELLGYGLTDLPPPEYLLGWVLERLHPDDWLSASAAYRRFIAGRTSRFEHEIRVRHKRGPWVELAALATIVAHDDGAEASEVIGILLDLTARRRLEHELREAQKLAAVGRLARGIAHEYNNVLTAVSAFGRFVQEALDPTGRAHADIQQVIVAATRGEALTAQLAALAHTSSSSPRPLSVDSALRAMQRMLAEIVGDTVDVSMTLSAAGKNVCIDPGSFEQVILNLVVNARDAMPGGGTVRITTAFVGGDADRSAEDLVKGERYVVITVSDEGECADADTVHAVFDPRPTPKEEARTRTSLGLTTCIGIVEQLSGYIRVESQSGRGATLTIGLPCPPDQTADQSKALAPKRSRGSETVIVAEDDEQVRTLVARVLSSVGYRVLTATTGAEALAVAEESSRPVDLLIADVVMPHMGGKELATRLRLLYPVARVLLMSGYSADGRQRPGTDQRGLHVLPKPFTPEALLSRVRAVLDDD